MTIAWQNYLCGELGSDRLAPVPPRHWATSDNARKSSPGAELEKTPTAGHDNHGALRDLDSVDGKTPTMAPDGPRVIPRTGRKSPSWKWRPGPESKHRHADSRTLGPSRPAARQGAAHLGQVPCERINADFRPPPLDRAAQRAAIHPEPRPQQRQPGHDLLAAGHQSDIISRGLHALTARRSSPCSLSSRAASFAAADHESAGRCVPSHSPGTRDKAN